MLCLIKLEENMQNLYLMFQSLKDWLIDFSEENDIQIVWKKSAEARRDIERFIMIQCLIVTV